MIPKIEAYTVATDTPKELLNKCSRIQFTLNSRIHPSKRRSVETVQKMRELFPKGEIFVHYDFVFIASRYMFLNYGTKKSIIGELRDLMSSKTGISGVVMHTDFPLRKELYSQILVSEESISEIVDKIYNKSLFEKQKIVDCVMNESTNEAILIYNLKGFVTDLFYQFDNIGCPLYLENTTKSADMDNMLQTLANFVQTMQDKYPYLGICLDTEHAFADTGFLFDSERVRLNVPKFKNFMVHLNPIPAEVLPGSKKDRHSETTLFECSEWSMEYYFPLISYLNKEGIPYIRECYQETIIREQEQLQQWAALPQQQNIHQ